MKKGRRKIIKIGALILLVFIAAVLLILIQSEYDKSVISRYASNENLPTIKDDWRGTPVDAQGRFVNDEIPFLPKMSDLLRWQLSGNPFKAEKLNDTARLEVRDPTAFLQSERDGILWLGHAGFFIRLGGASIIIDPVFGKPPFVRTFVEVPSPLDKIGKLDYILISHDHRDHADETTIRQLAGKFPGARIFAGLGMEDILNDWKTPQNDLQTAGWYQQFSLPDEPVKIFFLPARHWSRRGLSDTNKRLWGAFLIQGAGRTIYFGGDSGYDNHYKKLAALFPEIDYFIVGIGAYEPRWFMHANHNSPEDALRGFTDSKARVLIPMHFGRFDLSDEPPGQPLKILRERAAETNLSGKIKSLEINESIDLSK